jgi:hypothetical protein
MWYFIYSPRRQCTDPSRHTSPAVPNHVILSEAKNRAVQRREVTAAPSGA